MTRVGSLKGVSKDNGRKRLYTELHESLSDSSMNKTKCEFTDFYNKLLLKFNYIKYSIIIDIEELNETPSSPARDTQPNLSEYNSNIEDSSASVSALVEQLENGDLEEKIFIKVF